MHSHASICSSESWPKRPCVAMQYTFLASARLTTVSAAAIHEPHWSIRSSMMKTVRSLTLPTRVMVCSSSGFLNPSSSSSEWAVASIEPPRAEWSGWNAEIEDMKEDVMGSSPSSCGCPMTSPGRVPIEADIVDRTGDGASSSTMWPWISLPVMTSLARSSVYSSTDSSSSSCRRSVLDGPLVTGSLCRGILLVGGEAESTLVDWTKGLDRT